MSFDDRSPEVSEDEYSETIVSSGRSGTLCNIQRENRRVNVRRTTFGQPYHSDQQSLDGRGGFQVSSNINRNGFVQQNSVSGRNGPSLFNANSSNSGGSGGFQSSSSMNGNGFTHQNSFSGRRSLFDTNSSNNLSDPSNGINFGNATGNHRYSVAGKMVTDASGQPRGVGHLGYHHTPSDSKGSIIADISSSNANICGMGCVKRDHLFSAGYSSSNCEKNATCSYNHKPTDSLIELGISDCKYSTDYCAKGLMRNGNHQVGTGFTVCQRKNGNCDVKSSVEYRHKPTNTALFLDVEPVNGNPSVRAGGMVNIKEGRHLGAMGHFSSTPESTEAGFQIFGGFH